MKLNNCYNVKNINGVVEGFKVENNKIICNISASNFKTVMLNLLQKLKMPCFLIIEEPCDELQESKLRKTNRDPFHKNIYYLDNIDKKTMNFLMDKFGDVLINDGLSNFGFGSLTEQMEIYKGKYNSLYVFANDKMIDIFKEVLTKSGINEDKKLTIVNDILNGNNPGACSKYKDKEGLDIFKIINLLKECGLYLESTEEV